MNYKTNYNKRAVRRAETSMYTYEAADNAPVYGNVDRLQIAGYSESAWEPSFCLYGKRFGGTYDEGCYENDYCA